MVDDLNGDEIRILRLVAKGKPNKIIAGDLNYSAYTIGNKLRVIYQKLHATTRTQAVIYALNRKLMTLEE